MKQHRLSKNGHVIVTGVAAHAVSLRAKGYVDVVEKAPAPVEAPVEAPAPKPKPKSKDA